MKKGYIKIFALTLFTLIVSLLFTGKTYAASASITVKSNRASVAVGGTFTATVTVYSSSGIGAWEYNLKYDSSKLTLVDSSAPAHVADYAGGAGKTSASYTYTFKAKAAGSASISVSSYSVVDWNENQLSVSAGSTSVKVMTQAEIEASYSKNNYLKSLSVEGAQLSPEFNKDTLEYTVELEPETKVIKVNATKEDSTASVSGTGDIEVHEGDNQINVVVTAQNGSVRTYVINAKVKELSPIEVKVGKENLNVVRQKDALTAPEFYTETTVKIGEEEVPAFTSEITKLTLVGLRDDKGNIKLYIYDQKKNTYTPYIQVLGNKIIIYQPEELAKGIKVPKNYKKYTIEIDGNKVECYKLSKNSKFALIYGMNVENGKKNWYMYNTTEKTLQLYNEEEIDILNDQINNYFMIIIALSTLSGLLALILFIVIIVKISKKKSRKKEVKLEPKKKTNSKKSIKDLDF